MLNIIIILIKKTMFFLRKSKTNIHLEQTGHPKTYHFARGILQKVNEKLEFFGDASSKTFVFRSQNRLDL